MTEKLKALEACESFAKTNVKALAKQLKASRCNAGFEDSPEFTCLVEMAWNVRHGSIEATSLARLIATDAIIDYIAGEE